MVVGWMVAVLIGWGVSFGPAGEPAGPLRAEDRSDYTWSLVAATLLAPVALWKGTVSIATLGDRFGKVEGDRHPVNTRGIRDRWRERRTLWAGVPWWSPEMIGWFLLLGGVVVAWSLVLEPMEDRLEIISSVIEAA